MATGAELQKINEKAGLMKACVAIRFYNFCVDQGNLCFRGAVAFVSKQQSRNSSVHHRQKKFGTYRPFPLVKILVRKRVDIDGRMLNQPI